MVWPGAAATNRLAGIALISAAIMFFEILVLRIFSFTIWHHFAFMVISVALLGFSASGVIIGRRPTLVERVEENAARAAAGFAATAVLATAVFALLPFDPTRLADQPAQLLVLVLYYVVLAVPFTVGGLVVGLLLAAETAAAPRLYACDLVGAGVGAVAVVPLLPRLSAEGSVLVAAALALLSSGALHRRTLTLAAAVVALCIAPWAADIVAIPPGPGKFLHELLEDPQRPDERRTIYRRWNALARVDLVEGAPEVAWARNPRRPTKELTMPMLVLDGDAATPLVDAAAPTEDLAYLDHTLSSLPLQAFGPQRVLVIGAGGGVDVLTAMHHGAIRVDAVEINPDVIDIVSRRYADRTGGLFSRPGVRLIRAEGRSFAAHGDERYDLIQISLIDTWAASSSGAYSLTEGYLYTVEAFTEYFRRLGAEGVLAITRWGGEPPREILKLCAVAAAALERGGTTDPGRHLAIFGVAQLGNVLIKPSGFSKVDLDELRRVGSEHGFRPIYLPDGRGRREYRKLLEADDLEAYARAHPLDISPATDDRPYFFQFGRWRDLLDRDAWRERQFYLSGRLVLATVLLQALAFSVPLLALSHRSADRARPEKRAAAYFVVIGVAFMFVELSLMQRLTLYLGSPLLAASLVLATILIGAGIGSALSARWWPPSRSPGRLFALLAAASGLAAYGLPPLLAATIGWTLGARLALTATVVLAIGILLGMPLPTALARLGPSFGPGWVGRAWAANGAGSVLGPVLAAILSIEIGLSATLATGGVLYLLAGWVVARLWRTSGS